MQNEAKHSINSSAFCCLLKMLTKISNRQQAMSGDRSGVVSLCWSAGLTGELCAGPDCRPALRGLALSRAEDLRAELLRAEHLKAEALWEENSDGSRQAKTNILNSAQ